MNYFEKLRFLAPLILLTAGLFSPDVHARKTPPFYCYGPETSPNGAEGKIESMHTGMLDAGDGKNTNYLRIKLKGFDKTFQIISSSHSKRDADFFRSFIETRELAKLFLEARLNNADVCLGGTEQNGMINANVYEISIKE